MRLARFVDRTGDAPGTWVSTIADVGSILDDSARALMTVGYIDSGGNTRRRDDGHLNGYFIHGVIHGGADVLVVTLFDDHTYVTSRRNVQRYMNRVGQPWETQMAVVALLEEAR